MAIGCRVQVNGAIENAAQGVRAFRISISSDLKTSAIFIRRECSLDDFKGLCEYLFPLLLHCVANDFVV